MSNNYVIETTDLIKSYPGKIAVNKMNVHMRKGDIYGLIGKNGAGKTSLMKLLLGLTLPTSGKIKLLNDDNPDRARRKIGSLIEEPGLYRNETAFENLKRFSLLTGNSDKELKSILEMVGLADTGKKNAGSFSLGMRQRLGIAIALLGHPELLILDEPINGLDPAGIKEIRDTIIRLNSEGVSLMISSHLLDELGKIATCYGIVNSGVLVEEISAIELSNKCRNGIKIITDNGNEAELLLKRAFPSLVLSRDENTVHISSADVDSSELNRILNNNDIRVYTVCDESLDFEDFFIQRL